MRDASDTSNPLDFDAIGRKLPDHVAIIMDGNGRWAEQRGLPRVAGHKAGVESLRNTIKHAIQIELKYLTLFSFSSENWSRPAIEVDALMGLLRRFVRSDLADLKAKNVRVRIIGSRSNLPDDILSYLLEAENATSENTGLNLVVAFNYGSRDEICRSVQSLANKVAAGVLKTEDIDESKISSELDTAQVPDPDLLIRTSGESRLSNFLLWQLAYTEFVFLDVYWPDFSEQEFDRAISIFSKRDRRFGSLNASKNAV